MAREHAQESKKTLSPLELFAAGVVAYGATKVTMAAIMLFINVVANDNSDLVAMEKEDRTCSSCDDVCMLTLGPLNMCDCWIGQGLGSGCFCSGCVLGKAL
ncbi:MAG: hypothetical protein AAB439_02875 [Patescibacteria group bacterium]